MKYLIIFLLSGVGYALDCSEELRSAAITGQYEINTDVPSHLRGATITVTQADGKTSTVPAEQFKVVPRKQQFITKELTKNLVTSCRDGKNRVSILGGKGVQEGIKVGNPSPGVHTAESKAGFVGGLQYQRKISDNFSVGVQGQSNHTGSFMLGFDF